jgi:hypothetical protein
VNHFRAMLVNRWLSRSSLLQVVTRHSSMLSHYRRLASPNRRKSTLRVDANELTEGNASGEGRNRIVRAPRDHNPRHRFRGCAITVRHCIGRVRMSQRTLNRFYDHGDNIDEWLSLEAQATMHAKHSF